MDKRLPLALAVSLLIVIGWQFVFPPSRPPPPPPAAASGAASVASDGTNQVIAPPGSVVVVNGEKKPVAPEAPIVGTRVVGTDEPDLVVTVGKPGEIGLLRYVFTNRGGALKELRTGNYFDSVRLDAGEKARFEHWTMLLGPVETDTGVTASMLLRASSSSRALEREPLEEALWARTVLGPADAPTGVEFTLAPGTGVTFVKRFLFEPGTHGFAFELELRNDALPEASGVREFVFVPGACMPEESGDTWYQEPQAIAFSRPSNGTSEAPAIEFREVSGKVKDGSFPVSVPLSFAGVFNKYFAVLLHGKDEASAASLIGASYRRLRDENWARAHPADAQHAWRQIVADVQLALPMPALGQAKSVRFEVYAGPKDRKLLEKAWPDHSKVIEKDLGFFNGIASVLLAVLGFFHGIVRNWGVAIILLTISVRLILFPVNRRSQTAMARYQAKMKRLQPKIDEIKKRFAKDPSQQRQEQAKLMQTEGAFPPLGGCLPMFLQIPVFIGLFAALRCTFDLRQAPFFFWIQDLALPDRLLPMHLALPLVGTIEYLNVLPPLMVGLWIWQQMGMPVPADEQAARMQKMMMFMPVMMGFFLYNYAAGLSLYMITQSGLGIIEQKLIKKLWPIDDTEQPKKKSGFMARLMEAQAQQMKRQQEKKRKPRY